MPAIFYLEMLSLCDLDMSVLSIVVNRYLLIVMLNSLCDSSTNLVKISALELQCLSKSQFS
jgi:hypothetical protein